MGQTKVTTKNQSAPEQDWSQLYLDLPESLAQKLRQSRIKPEQITQKSDGEILSLKGIGDVALETIRTKYPAEIKPDTPPKKKTPATVKKEALPIKKAPKKKKTRSRRYQNLLKKIDQTRPYNLQQALETLTETSQNHASKTLELHLNLTETNLRGEAKLPHSLGKQAVIEVFSDQTIAKLDNQQIDFDILLARPSDMSKLAKYAKLLGPKGLLPNPKNKTLTEDPEKRAKTLSQGTILAYKTEANFPLIHLNLGKINQDLKQTQENITALLATIDPLKIKSAYLTTTQSPSLKLDLSAIL